MSSIVVGVRRRWGWGVLAIVVCAAVLLVTLAREVWWARTFPVVHDAAILHYVAWMISRGHAPYLQQVEINLPGVLMTEWATMRVFGADAAGLWRWDTFVGLCAVGTAAALAGRGVRLAGACGAMLAWLVHLNDGAYNLGEREWLIAVLLMGAAWCAARCMEARQAMWMAPCVVLAGWAATEKPFAVLMTLVLVGAALVDAWRPDAWRPDVWGAGDVRRAGNLQRNSLPAVLGWSCAGGLLPAMATIVYFRHWPGSFAAFWHTEHTLGTWYAAQGNNSLRYLFFRVMSYPLLAVLGLGVYLAVRAQIWRERRGALLAAGFVIGVAMYVGQRKGFPYHVYPLLLIGLPLGFVCAQRAAESRAWDRRVIAAIVLLLGGLRLPLKIWRNHALNVYPVGTQQAVVADLRRLGAASLNGSVQCLDMTLGGCVGALYELRIEQPTGFVNDTMLFSGESRPFLADLQNKFLLELQSHPAKVIILSAHNWPKQDDFSFSKLKRWPQFATYLKENYRLESTFKARTHPHTADYQVYVRR